MFYVFLFWLIILILPEKKFFLQDSSLCFRLLSLSPSLSLLSSMLALFLSFSFSFHHDDEDDDDYLSIYLSKHFPKISLSKIIFIF